MDNNRETHGRIFHLDGYRREALFLSLFLRPRDMGLAGNPQGGLATAAGKAILHNETGK
jgi:hypothetical protein